MGASRTPTARRRKWDADISPLLRPLVRAYLLGYASAVAPRLLTLLLQLIKSRRRNQKTEQQASSESSSSTVTQQASQEPFFASLKRVLCGGLDPQRFPTFCAVLVGGSTLLEIPLRAAFNRLLRNLSEVARKRLSRWFASFIAAWFSLQLLQSNQSSGFFTETVPIKKQSDDPDSTTTTTTTKYQTIRYAGRTLDLSLFAATRALDVIGGELWHRRHNLFSSPSHPPLSPSPKRRRPPCLTSSTVTHLTDPAIFALSSGLIMWAWIYLPSRLPRAYNRWIASAAAVDPRLIEALQLCRSRAIRYGVDTGRAPLLAAMCADYRLPPRWGDPAVSVPFPCELVHMGCGPSCERHALSRFARSFRWAMATYLPLNLLLAVRAAGRGPAALMKSLQRALVSAARSSSFLGAFIALFYYGVCLMRTRLGPRVLGTGREVRQRIDGGLCVAAGCVLCGWSIMLENAGRRKDMALFVAPRALATLLPRRYAWDMQWRETFVFSFSTAVVFTCVLENRARVRGVLGGVLASVLKP
ncbi:hypothetical protein B0T17DRAFT_483469 [Bombardia bombarda]|uniref:Integral membrane protein n=1 Tax=Bombardia bombarda TaxID=252184 RepID=A0AA39XJD2_9PEZI|nr:hypothetical protein B0T17DRAFT_483469 [Bombardia bombarda]